MDLLTTLDHPAFRQCELVPSIVAIKWAHSLSQESIRSNLSRYSLKPATETPTLKEQEKPSDSARDPRPVNINQSESLTWAFGAEVTEQALDKLNTDETADWAAPVYRATKAERALCRRVWKKLSESESPLLTNWHEIIVSQSHTDHKICANLTSTD